MATTTAKTCCGSIISRVIMRRDDEHLRLNSRHCARNCQPSGGFMTGKRRHILTIFFLTAFAVADAGAEKIRTSIPGANLNYLSVYSADERHFFRDEGLDNETI